MKQHWGVLVGVVCALSGCAFEGADEVGETEPAERLTESLTAGIFLNLAARPYEELLVDVNGCTGTLVPNNDDGIARYVVTARHCLDGGVTAESRVVRRGADEELLSFGSAIHMHPDTFASNNRAIDVALLELQTPVPVNSKLYFSSLTPLEMVGLTARCYGSGGVAGAFVRSGRFNLVKTDGNGHTDIHYGVREPGLNGEHLVAGDSGGPCFRITGTTSGTMFGIHKASGSTLARHMASVSFSDWIRDNFVPR